MGKYKMDHRIT